MSPTSPPATLSDALVVVGSRQASELDATITLLRVRPVDTMPTSPSSTAAHRVLPGWSNAERICSARAPLTPASSATSSASTQLARNPATPTTNTSSGTKNKNKRNASALPTTVPAISRSRR